MLMRTDPFREFDRAVGQLLRPAVAPTTPQAMPVDAWREGDAFFISVDLPGVDPDSIDLDVERTVLTVRASREPLHEDAIVSERPHGTFARQFVLGDNLDVEAIRASYEAGVLTLRIPIAERARSRKIPVTTASADVLTDGGEERRQLAGDSA